MNDLHDSIVIILNGFPLDQRLIATLTKALVSSHDLHCPSHLAVQGAAERDKLPVGEVIRLLHDPDCWITDGSEMGNE
jgi:hypothetical protein